MSLEQIFNVINQGATVKEACNNCRAIELEIEEVIKLKLISKKEAITKGAPVYKTGLSCKNGHNDGRYVKTGHCVGCRRENYSANKTDKIRISHYVHKNDVQPLIDFAEALNWSRENKS